VVKEAQLGRDSMRIKQNGGLGIDQQGDADAGRDLCERDDHPPLVVGEIDESVNEDRRTVQPFALFDAVEHMFHPSAGSSRS